MVTFIEELIGSGVGVITGNDTLLGIIFLGFFTAFVLLQNTRLDGKLVVLVPISILSLVFIPMLAFLLALGFGFILYLAVSKFANR